VLYVAVFLAMIINLVDGSRWAKFSWSTSEWWFRRLAVRAGAFLVFYSGLRPMYLFLYFYAALYVVFVFSLPLLASWCA